jgi:uncharacterized protein YndB with AHSA1/START domain
VIFSETFELPAPAQEVFAALLDEELLTRWLAERVRVDARKGGVFQFWGRDVIWCNSENETHGEILELDSPHTLVFSWRWKNHQSRVSLRVSETGSGSRLAVEHSFESIDERADGPGPDMAGCHWRIAVGNLTGVLSGDRAPLRPDYVSNNVSNYVSNSSDRSDSADSDRVELEIEIATTPARVFRALLDPAQVKVWMQVDAPEIDADAGQYSYGWQLGEPATPHGPSRIVELIPDRLLVHDWQWVGEPSGQIRWELSPCTTGTRLRLIHTRTRSLSYVLGWSDALVAIWRLLNGPTSRSRN